MRALALIAALLFSGVSAATDTDVERILERFEQARPDAKALAFYSLDWAPNLQEAQARARRERRPVFLIVNTNISAGCNFYSGHT